MITSVTSGFMWQELLYSSAFGGCTSTKTLFGSCALVTFAKFSSPRKSSFHWSSQHLHLYSGRYSSILCTYLPPPERSTLCRGAVRYPLGPNSAHLQKKTRPLSAIGSSKTSYADGEHFTKLSPTTVQPSSKRSHISASTTISITSAFLGITCAQMVSLNDRTLTYDRHLLRSWMASRQSGSIHCTLCSGQSASLSESASAFHPTTSLQEHTCWFPSTS